MILLAGGTGVLGRRVVNGLAARGFAVRVLARHAEAPAGSVDGVDHRRGDVTRRADVDAAMDGVTTVVSAVHGFLSSPEMVDRDGNANLIAAATSRGADFVLVSIVGVAADSPVDLFRMKHEAEERLRRSALRWTVVRPTAYMETWIEVLEQTAARSGRPTVFGRGRNPINFVSADDVAALVVEAVTDPSMRGRTITIGGPENLTMDHLAARVQRAAGRSSPPRHVPRAGLRTMAVVMAPFKPPLARQARTALLMDGADMTFDDTALRQEFPDLPRTTLEQVLAHRVPADSLRANAAAAPS